MKSKSPKPKSKTATKQGAGPGRPAPTRYVKRSIKEIFDGMPNKVHCLRITGGILFRWSRKGVGFGELTMRVAKGKLEVDTDCMGPDFCADIVKQAISESLHNASDVPRADARSIQATEKP